MKTCKNCKKTLKETDFYNAGKGNNQTRAICKRCFWEKEKPKRIAKRCELNKYNRERYLKPKIKEKILEKNQKWHKDNWETILPKKAKRFQENSWARKQQVVFFYTKGTMSCSRCKEQDIDLLTVEHINGNGIKHRKKISSSIEKWLVDNDFPEEYDILCRNCNWKQYLLKKDIY